MLVICSLAFAICALPAQGQSATPNVTTFARAAAGARQAFAADSGRLWGTRLDTLSWMGVDGKTIYLTADPHQSGYTLLTGSLWSGPLPEGIAPANTSVEWAGRRWAMVMLPVPADSVAATRLLIHEAAHVAQPHVLPRPVYSETGTGSGLLDEPDGRTWLRLELRALASALRSKGSGQRAATRDALTFRAARYIIASRDERERERALDVTEGMPEYTAWKLTRSPRSAFIAQVDSAPAILSSLVRGFPYYTGPAYAMLLDDFSSGGWRHELSSTPDLQRLLGGAAATGANGRPVIPSVVLQVLRDTIAPRTWQRSELIGLAEKRASKYGARTIRAEETARWEKRLRRIAVYRERFVEGPTIRIRPGTPLSVSFDPRGQTSLGAAGTVMANLVWKSHDGAVLTAPGGALVTPTWSEVRVPLGSAKLEPGTLTTPLEAAGDGWTLSIPAGWTVNVDGASWAIVPPTSPR